MIALGLFILFLGIGIGGGVYETLVVYPLWKRDPKPATFAKHLRDSGQAGAGRRLWPFVSPVAFLLAVWNIVDAARAGSDVRTAGLAAAIAIAFKSVATYTYFAPAMIRKLERAGSMLRQDLARTVKRWTTLSPLRIGIEVPAMIAALYAFGRLGAAR